MIQLTYVIHVIPKKKKKDENIPIKEVGDILAKGIIYKNVINLISYIYAHHNIKVDNFIIFNVKIIDFNIKVSKIIRKYPKHNSLYNFLPKKKS